MRRYASWLAVVVCLAGILWSAGGVRAKSVCQRARATMMYSSDSTSATSSCTPQASPSALTTKT